MSKKHEKKVSKLAVIGLGYVGLPLALLAAKKNVTTVGVDVDKMKMRNLKAGKSYIDDVSDEEVATSKASFSDDPSNVSDTDAVIICVPTPVNEDKQPDLTPVTSAVKSVAPYLKKGSLLVIESTVNPGVCDDIVAPLVEQVSGKKIGEDIYLAHCPERINPGDPNWNVSNIARVVGANSKHELELATSLYQELIDAPIKPMGSLKEAEAVKVVENSFRDINIAFVNELAMSFHKLGINIENVIDGAATKPFAFMPHRPGAGVGGHCIPVDPYYLIEYAHNYGFEHDFLRLARSINESMPGFTVDLLTEALNEHEMSIKDTRITLLGLSYKPNVGDERESPALVIKKILLDAGADLAVYDPYVKEGSTAPDIKSALHESSAIVIATGHEEFAKHLTTDALKKSGIKVVIDGRNLLKNDKDTLIANGITYKGIGV